MEVQSDIDIRALFEDMREDGKTGLASKTRSVDARPAQTGEIVVTIVSGRIETTSPPANNEDMVVRNRCETTGNEEILVRKDKFAERYEGPHTSPNEQGWAEYRPVGKKMAYFVVPPDQAPFSFVAPWGEAMPAEPGDYIVQDPTDPADTYRIERNAFQCTYKVLIPAVD